MTYNNNWVLDKYQKGEKLKFIFFWGNQPAADGSISASCFSQWWPSSFEADGIFYKTAEHWMMAGKARLFGDENTLQQILKAVTPAEAQKKGRMIKGFNAGLWDEKKFNLVVTGNLHKFSSDAGLKEFLLGTAERILVEASPVDRIWGIGMAANDPSVKNPLAWRGENLLGYALMEVRDKLKQ